MPNDEDSKKILDAEREYIKAWRTNQGHGDSAIAEPEEQNLVGLGLSGGGIRSASFCLGVMQSLAKEKLFKRIDYLSTVSGGGYIGSAITWLKSDKSNSLENSYFKSPDDFPFGTGEENTTDDSGGLNAKMLRFLREHGNYLAPGGGITTKSLVAVFLRGSILTFSVWFLISLSIMLSIISWSIQIPEYQKIKNEHVFEGYQRQIWKLYQNPIFYIPEQVSCLTSEDLAKLPEAERIKLVGCTLEEYLTHFPISLNILILSGYVAFLFLGLCVVYSFATRFSWGVGVKEKLKLHTNATRFNYFLSRYNYRRFYEITMGCVLTLTVILLVLGSLPVTDYYIDEAGGISTIVLGLLGGVWSYIKTKSDNDSKIPLGLVASLGARLFIYGAIFVSFLFADDIINKVALPSGSFSGYYDAFSTYEFRFKHPIYHNEFFDIGDLVLFLMLFAVALGVIVNLNQITIHRYYRDRLMESFLPDIDSALDNKTGPAKGAEITSLDAIQNADNANSPYHIINTNLVLVDSDNKTYRSRGGDNFILSPLYCGSNATGWKHTSEFMKGRMDLASAMAISGAAANPNTGVGGKGVTRNPIVSILMALLNIRLGYWISNPNSKLYMNPNHFIPGLYEIWGSGYDENRGFLQISDGGHFENTGMYELVRRRCKLIIICDAGADKDFTFSDFQNTLKRIESDFGARVDFDEDNQFEQLIPMNWVGYPQKTLAANSGFIEGIITYSGGDRDVDSYEGDGKGKLIFIKTTMIEEVSLEVKGYKGANPDFPDQSTADQFFSEEQFEAYRKLGKKIGLDMIEGVQLKGLMDRL